jgi:excisionase family DNA binding protein
MGPSRSSRFLRRRQEASGSIDVTVADGASSIDGVDGKIVSVPSPSKSGSKIPSDIPPWAGAEVCPGHRAGLSARGRPDQFDPEAGASGGLNSPVVKERPFFSKQRVSGLSRLEPLLTVGETAAILNVSPRTVRRLIAARAIPAVSIGRSVRVRPRDVGRLIAEGGVLQ